MSLWLEDTRRALPGDWAARPTFRVTLPDGRAAILIETVPDTDPKAIQGHLIGDYARIADYLRSIGARAPTVYHADPAGGILLVEDLGEHNWGQLLPQDQNAFYEQAVDTLIAFRNAAAPAIDLPEFQNSYIFGRTVWFMDEFMGNTDPGKRRAFIQAWDALLDTLRERPQTFMHGDFHPGNLMKLPDGGLGLLDFGAAMTGAGEYDLVNLLEDIRRDVPPDIKTAMKTRYNADPDAYAVLHAQFYTRLLGQMTKRGMAVPKGLKVALDGLIHRHAVLAPLKTLVLG